MNERGFTLVETLVSLIAGGLLLGSISWVLAGLGDDLRMVETSRDQDFLEAQRTVQRLLGEGRFWNAELAALPRSDNHLSFQTPAPLALGKPGLAMANLQLVEENETEKLVLSWEDEKIPAVTLLQNMEDASFEYELAGGSSDPDFVRRITIGWTDFQTSEPQTISIRPKINALGACIFDPISQQCRL